MVGSGRLALFFIKTLPIAIFLSINIKYQVLFFNTTETESHYVIIQLSS